MFAPTTAPSRSHAPAAAAAGTAGSGPAVVFSPLSPWRPPATRTAAAAVVAAVHAHNVIFLKRTVAAAAIAATATAAPLSLSSSSLATALAPPLSAPALVPLLARSSRTAFALAHSLADDITLNDSHAHALNVSAIADTTAPAYSDVLARAHYLMPATGGGWAPLLLTSPLHAAVVHCMLSLAARATEAATAAGAPVHGALPRWLLGPLAALVADCAALASTSTSSAATQSSRLGTAATRVLAAVVSSLAAAPAPTSVYPPFEGPADATPAENSDDDHEATSNDMVDDNAFALAPSAWLPHAGPPFATVTASTHRGPRVTTRLLARTLADASQAATNARADDTSLHNTAVRAFAEKLNLQTGGRVVVPLLAVAALQSALPGLTSAAAAAAVNASDSDVAVAAVITAGRVAAALALCVAAGADLPAAPVPAQAWAWAPRTAARALCSVSIGASDKSGVPTLRPAPAAVAVLLSVAAAPATKGLAACADAPLPVAAAIAAQTLLRTALTVMQSSAPDIRATLCTVALAAWRLMRLVGAAVLATTATLGAPAPLSVALAAAVSMSHPRATMESLWQLSADMMQTTSALAPSEALAAVAAAAGEVTPSQASSGAVAMAALVRTLAAIAAPSAAMREQAQTLAQSQARALHASDPHAALTLEDLNDGDVDTTLLGTLNDSIAVSAVSRGVSCGSTRARNYVATVLSALIAAALSEAQTSATSGSIAEAVIRAATYSSSVLSRVAASHPRLLTLLLRAAAHTARTHSAPVAQAVKPLCTPSTVTSVRMLTTAALAQLLATLHPQKTCAVDCECALLSQSGIHCTRVAVRAWDHALAATAALAPALSCLSAGATPGSAAAAAASCAVLDLAGAFATLPPSVTVASAPGGQSLPALWLLGAFPSPPPALVAAVRATAAAL